MMGVRVLLVLFAVALLHRADAQPLDAVDNCLFTCDYCFKGDVLVNCANECLLSEHSEMSSTWTDVCPYFGLIAFEKR